MKSICKIGLIALLMLLSQDNEAQVKLTELKVGDKLPEVVLKNLIGNNIKSVNLSEKYKKGLLIIDFWATWCSPCIREMTKADSLVAQFKELTVISVSHDDSAVVKKFFNNHREIKHDNLIISCDDKALSQYFPHKIIPHNIWIDRNGVVKLITGAESINGKNIESFLKDAPITIKSKHEDLTFNPARPYHVADDQIEYRSIITHHNDSIPSGVTYDGALGRGVSNRIFSFNSSIVDLYWLAFVHQLTCFVNYDFVELHVKDTSKYVYPTTHDAKSLRFLKSSSYNKENSTIEEQIADWQSENTFCYDLILPKPVNYNLFESYIFNDLDRYFNIKGMVENRIINSPVLILDKNYDTAKVKRFIAPPGYVMKNSGLFKWSGNSLIINNRTLSQIMAYMISFGIEDFDRSTFPFVNETGLEYPVSMTIDFPKAKIESHDFYDALNKLGLKFIRAKRKVPVLVITEN